MLASSMFNATGQSVVLDFQNSRLLIDLQRILQLNYNFIGENIQPHLCFPSFSLKAKQSKVY